MVSCNWCLLCKRSWNPALWTLMGLIELVSIHCLRFWFFCCYWRNEMYIGQILSTGGGSGSGWGTHVHPWWLHVNVRQKPLQYCKVISLQLNKFILKINKNIKKKPEALYQWHCHLRQIQSISSHTVVLVIFPLCVCVCFMYVVNMCVW